ncbi:MAG TPA: HIRAN domain-containing protein [Chitinophagales bacterium]|nr:HIRAN domain-containing protein [Chitinophagales bacterium]
MERSDFLKTLGLGIGGLIMPSNSFINVQSIKIYDNYVKGMKHYNFNEISHQIKEGDELQLLRAPENTYDSFAIRVLYKEQKLGYIAAFENVVLANMMDKGVKLNAFVSQIDLTRNIYEALAVEIHAELVIPTQKLIDSLLAENRADDANDIYRNKLLNL